MRYHSLSRLPTESHGEPQQPRQGCRSMAAKPVLGPTGRASQNLQKGCRVNARLEAGPRFEGRLAPTGCLDEEGSPLPLPLS